MAAGTAPPHGDRTTCNPGHTVRTGLHNKTSQVDERGGRLGMGGERVTAVCICSVQTMILYRTRPLLEIKRYTSHSADRYVQIFGDPPRLLVFLNHTYTRLAARRVLAGDCTFLWAGRALGPLVARKSAPVTARPGPAALLENISRSGSNSI